MLLGIDEVGRGPLAGPLVIGGVIFNNDKINKSDAQFIKINDSKKLDSKKRENLFEYIKSISIFSDVVIIDNKTIDEYGISFALSEGLKNLIKKVFNKNIEISKIIFDGNVNPIKNTKFYEEEIKKRDIIFENLIGADSKVKEVSAASIIAKVIRDRILYSYSKIYPLYKFEKNKGYGTKDHIIAIKKFGYCDIHRKSFKIKEFDSKLLF